MKNSRKTEPVNNDLFAELYITVNPELENVKKTGSSKKIVAAKKILSKVNWPSSFGATS